MRGLLIGALSLAALDLVVQAPVNRVTAGLALPARWLAEWMSPSVPLVPDKAGTTATTTAAAPATAQTQPATTLL